MKKTTAIKGRVRFAPAAACALLALIGAALPARAMNAQDCYEWTWNSRTPPKECESQNCPADRDESDTAARNAVNAFRDEVLEHVTASQGRQGNSFWDGVGKAVGNVLGIGDKERAVREKFQETLMGIRDFFRSAHCNLQLAHVVTDRLRHMSPADRMVLLTVYETLAHSEDPQVLSNTLLVLDKEIESLTGFWDIKHRDQNLRNQWLSQMFASLDAEARARIMGEVARTSVTVLLQGVSTGAATLSVMGVPQAVPVMVAANSILLILGAPELSRMIDYDLKNFGSLRLDTMMKVLEDGAAVVSPLGIFKGLSGPSLSTLRALGMLDNAFDAKSSAESLAALLDTLQRHGGEAFLPGQSDFYSQLLGVIQGAAGARHSFIESGHGPAAEQSPLGRSLTPEQEARLLAGQSSVLEIQARTESDPARRQALSAQADVLRLEAARRVLGEAPSAAEAQGILAAHRIGLEAGPGARVSLADLAAKVDALENAGIMDLGTRRQLIENYVVGLVIEEPFGQRYNPPSDAPNYAEFRMAYERKQFTEDNRYISLKPDSSQGELRTPAKVLGFRKHDGFFYLEVEVYNSLARTSEIRLLSQAELDSARISSTSRRVFRSLRNLDPRTAPDQMTAQFRESYNEANTLDRELSGDSRYISFLPEGNLDPVLGRIIGFLDLDGQKVLVVEYFEYVRGREQRLRKHMTVPELNSASQSALAKEQFEEKSDAKGKARYNDAHTFSLNGTRYTLVEKLGAGVEGTAFRAKTDEGSAIVLKFFERATTDSYFEYQAWIRSALTKRGIPTPQIIAYSSGPGASMVSDFVDGMSISDLRKLLRDGELTQDEFNRIAESLDHSRRLANSLKTDPEFWALAEAEEWRTGHIDSNGDGNWRFHAPTQQWYLVDP